MKPNPVSSDKRRFRPQGLRRNFKPKKNPNAPKTRKELRKDSRKNKKAEKHTFLLKRFGKAPEAPPKKKRRQKKKSIHQKSLRDNTRKQTGMEGDNGESESESDQDRESRPLKLDEEKLKKEMELVRKKRLIEDNAEEDRTIRSLHKKLKLNKKSVVPASFRVDGLDYLLDFCNDLDTKKDTSKVTTSSSMKGKTEEHESGEEEDQDGNEQEEDGGNSDLEGSTDSDDDGQDLESDDEEGGEEDEVDEESDEEILDVSVSKSIEDGNSEGDEVKESELWEDIYGRLRDKDGNVVKDTSTPSASSSSIGTQPSTGKYVPPMKRQTHQRDKINKSLKGLFNRLSESNMHSIAAQIETFYMENSRNEMNESLLELMSAVLVGPVLSSDRIILEHVMLIAVLHANVGSEVGAFFVQTFVQRFHTLYNQGIGFGETENGKQLENLMLIVSYMYHFKIVDCCLIYDILKLLGESFGTKDVELILAILRSIGFRLRKDDPASLKSLIQLLQQKAQQAQTGTPSSRVKFMLEILLAIRNNNMSKIPNYDPEYGEHLLKVIKIFIHKGNYVSELKISMKDLLNADTKGRWWILGSAWNNVAASVGIEQSVDNGNGGIVEGQGNTTIGTGNKKLLAKAKKLGMNTDTRRNIFLILMIAEDYVDAYEKLVHLGLKNQLEREIIHVLIYCCLHEKKFNPYYALLASKFCSLDRRFKLSTQYTLWDRLKEFPDNEPHHLKNFTQFLIHLINDRSLPITVLKVIDFSDMRSWKLVFLKEVLAGILLQPNTDNLEEIFMKPGLSTSLHLFRESVKLFMNHFMLNEEKVVTAEGGLSSCIFTDPQIRNLLIERIKLAEKSLSLGHSKVQL